MQSVISIKNLSKTYESGFQALKGIDLDIRRGEIFALLGPNGAGKTTAIAIVSSLVTKTAGTASVFGYDIDREHIWGSEVGRKNGNTEIWRRRRVQRFS